MFKGLSRSFGCRAFSKSSMSRNLGKAKPPESSTSTPQSSSQTVSDMSMSFAPSEFEKKLLLLAGKYKSREEIPPRIRYETMDYAKSKLRIKIANILMLVTVLSCVGVIFLGKKRQREGDTILKRVTDRENELRNESRKKTNE